MRPTSRIGAVAAREVFREGGIEALLDTIARRAGVSNATLYRNFPTRCDLVAAMLLPNLERSAEELRSALAQPSAWQGLVSYLTWHFAEQIDNPVYMSTLRAVPAGEDDEVDRLRNSIHADLRELLDRAKVEGSVRQDRWVEDVLLALALNETLGHGGYEDPQSASRRFLDLTLSALAARPVARLSRTTSR